MTRETVHFFNDPTSSKVQMPGGASETSHIHVAIDTLKIHTYWKGQIKKEIQGEHYSKIFCLLMKLEDIPSQGTNSLTGWSFLSCFLGNSLSGGLTVRP